VVTEIHVVPLNVIYPTIFVRYLYSISFNIVLYLRHRISVLTFESLVITLCTVSFEIKKFYMVLTLCLYVVYGSQNNPQLLPYTSLKDWFCITEVDSIYCAVRTESLYTTNVFRLYRVNILFTL